MSARLEVVSGARAGLLFPLTGDIVTVGRGADCHLRLDPDADLQVSARHVALRRHADGWSALDLGSRNGTYINGEPIAGATPLHDGDRIGLGADGPVLRFLAGAASLPGPTGPARDRRPRLLRRALISGIALAIVGGATFIYADRSARRSWASERRGLQERLDSLRRESERTEAGLRGQVTGLAEALQASRNEVAELRTEVSRASAAGDATRTAALRARLQVAADALRGQQRAASLDFAEIERANRRAVAMIYVEYEDGRVATATAFAVTPDGVLLTNRHAILGPDGRDRPRRIGIQFSDSEQVWPAQLLATDEDADLAAVRVGNIAGAVPTVRAFNLRSDTLASEAPVALIGFPLGGAAPTFVQGHRVVRPLLGAGILLGERADTLELQGYGASGASGTPVFDATGAVVGVLFGGRKDGAIQTLYAVPAPVAARLVAGLRRVSSP